MYVIVLCIMCMRTPPIQSTPSNVISHTSRDNAVVKSYVLHVNGHVIMHTLQNLQVICKYAIVGVA